MAASTLFGTQPARGVDAVAEDEQQRRSIAPRSAASSRRTPRRSPTSLPCTFRPRTISRTCRVSVVSADRITTTCENVTSAARSLRLQTAEQRVGRANQMLQPSSPRLVLLSSTMITSTGRSCRLVTSTCCATPLSVSSKSAAVRFGDGPLVFGHQHVDAHARGAASGTSAASVMRCGCWRCAAATRASADGGCARDGGAREAHGDADRERAAS